MWHMTLAACPNCSGYIHDPGYWIIGRPALYTGRNSGRIFIISCCEFSEARLTYETKEAACAAWAAYRTAKAAKNPRLKNMMERLDQYEQQQAQRFKPNTTPPASAA